MGISAFTFFLLASLIRVTSHVISYTNRTPGRRKRNQSVTAAAHSITLRRARVACKRSCTMLSNTRVLSPHAFPNKLSSSPNDRTGLLTANAHVRAMWHFACSGGTHERGSINTDLSDMRAAVSTRVTCACCAWGDGFWCSIDDRAESLSPHQFIMYVIHVVFLRLCGPLLPFILAYTNV